MKAKRIIGISLAVVVSAMAAQAALFTQDFSSSTTVGDYVHATTPTANQFTVINGAATSIEAGRLKIINAAGSGSNVKRWVDMEGTPVGGMSFSFEMELVFSEADGTRLYTATIGEPDSGNNFMAWGINATGVENEWDVVGGISAKFTGAQTVTIVLNDSDSAFDYTDPATGTQALASNSYDIWVGTTLVSDGKSGAYVHPENDLTAFDIGLTAAPAVTYYFDNFQVEAIPEPATLGMVGLGGLAILFIRRNVEPVGGGACTAVKAGGFSPRLIRWESGKTRRKVRNARGRLQDFPQDGNPTLDALQPGRRLERIKRLVRTDDGKSEGYVKGI